MVDTVQVGSAGIVTLAGVIIMQGLAMLSAPDWQSKAIGAVIILGVFGAALWRENVKPPAPKE
jgi:hypothetical protein